MGYALPSGVVNTGSLQVYPANGSFSLGAHVKQPDEQLLVVVDYSEITPLMTLGGYSFSVDVSSNPQLIISYPSIDSANAGLMFLLSGGIAGQQYNISITANANPPTPITAEAAFTTDYSAIAMPHNPGGVTNGMPVFDVTAGVSLRHSEILWYNFCYAKSGRIFHRWGDDYRYVSQH